MNKLLQNYLYNYPIKCILTFLFVIIIIIIHKCSYLSIEILITMNFKPVGSCIRSWFFYIIKDYIFDGWYFSSDVFFHIMILNIYPEFIIFTMSIYLIYLSFPIIFALKDPPLNLTVIMFILHTILINGNRRLFLRYIILTYFLCLIELK